MMQRSWSKDVLAARLEDKQAEIRRLRYANRKLNKQLLKLHALVESMSSQYETLKRMETFRKYAHSDLAEQTQSIDSQ